MTVDPQQEIVDFLSQRLDAQEEIATHISLVLLGETRVYKLKRAVRLPYLDFSTPALRGSLCEREVELNRRFAPSLYLGVRRVTREANGALALDGDGASWRCAAFPTTRSSTTWRARGASRGT